MVLLHDTECRGMWGLCIVSLSSVCDMSITWMFWDSVTRNSTSYCEQMNGSMKSAVAVHREMCSKTWDNSCVCVSWCGWDQEQCKGGAAGAGWGAVLRWPACSFPCSPVVHTMRLVLVWSCVPGSPQIAPTIFLQQHAQETVILVVRGKASLFLLSISCFLLVNTGRCRIRCQAWRKAAAAGLYPGSYVFDLIAFH